jgi:hypothetical protein
MKIRILSCIALICLIYLLPVEDVVQAQAGIVCHPDPRVVTYPSDDKHGFDITRAEKTYPNFPLIVTQDPKHTGTNIVVEIRSYPGIISYETYDEVCIGFDRPQRGLTSCSPYFSAGQYYFLQGTCTPHTETVFRYIEGESLKVWLEPTLDTKKWLGWSTESLGNDNYPLRYLFPEKWALGTWTPEGFTTEGDLGLWTEEEIRKFLAEHPGYNFLKADPRHNKIPSQYLPLAEDPLDRNGQVVPLFGEGFTTWDPFGPVTQKGGCLIAGTGPDGQGYCAITVNDRTDPLFGSADLDADNITFLSVSFSRIPMDLPGEWHIAVKISVRPAVYAGGKEEKIANPDDFIRMPNGGFEHLLPEHAFLTYMWISTPCNPNEIHGCDN